MSLVSDTEGFQPMDTGDFDEGFGNEVSRTLLVDGDIIVYRPCCVLNEDTDEARKLIARNIRTKLDQLAEAAECDSYIIYLTTKNNFRDYITDDYKANRKDVERPVNLTWAKRYAFDHLGAEVVKGLEADDLLAINQTKDTVIWSLDKDLRQVAGSHLDDATMEVIEISELGEVYKKGKKFYFTGYKGFMFQALTGDSTDHILGCAKRLENVYKSGARKGESYLKRTGVGPAAAARILDACEQSTESFTIAVGLQYRHIYGDSWQKEMEKQVNLLFMIRDYEGDEIKLWTYDGRYRSLNLKTGVFTDEAN